MGARFKSDSESAATADCVHPADLLLFPSYDRLILSVMRLYLDVCCLARPHDDQEHSRVRLETEAITDILDRCASGEHVWVTSEAIVEELSRDANLDRRNQVISALKFAGEHALSGPELLERAAQLAATGIRPTDALHLATAENARCDVLLTTDDRFIHRAGRLKPASSVRVLNPLQWLMENQA